MFTREDVQRIEDFLVKQYPDHKPYKPQRKGFVYFVQAEDGGPIKIGWAQDVASRVRQLQVGQSRRLRVIDAIKCSRTYERKLHRQFAASRLFGEWFEPTPELLELIEREGLRSDFQKGAANVG